eukprot:1157745-Pelagomonas_calceolata.AAC.2
MPVACTAVSSSVVLTAADPLSFFFLNDAALMPVVILCLAHDVLGGNALGGNWKCSAGFAQHFAWPSLAAPGA